jgi:hypothetical protein
MRAKTINEDVRDILRPKSEEEIEKAIDKKVKELCKLDISDLVENLANQFNIDTETAASVILSTTFSVVKKDVKEDIIRTVYLDILEYAGWEEEPEE